ncbi:hypothetical protein J3L18_00545 [Mucilaginibacter gossypii]|uniref:DUF6896 domain-containing protein n=1 Tax=Mucilaginibacter gossypii TaxID=551996 RepID=UPI000DCD18A7|nr:MULTISPECIES: hypothetical protein [Mucilaginibacter]QTE37589.1 hypothetical protein J3L18_00545 [Mucilaginibacter gossypii]RAV58433.1 hypothetical protein DIU36_10015 [Mucilaginibacter rubeus]
MDRITQTLIIGSVKQIPSLEVISKIPREKRLRLIFEQTLQYQREEIGKKLKNDLKGFQVYIHATQPEINIAKLLTDKEIDDNQLFFEQCAKDYRALSELLINKLASKLGIEINPQFPLSSFSPFFANKKQSGIIKEWRYFLHGFHCGFEHKRSGQIIEVPLVFGLEFGDLDPYFFTRFIKSTQNYFPLPIDIYDEYADGVRIIERMLALNKFERITSNIENHTGVVVNDRKKIHIEVYQEDALIDTKKKFNVLRFFGLK